MKKKIGYTLLIVVLIIIIAGAIGIYKFNNALFKDKPNYLTYTFENKPIPFIWARQRIGGHYEPQAAMLIPVNIKSIPLQLYMQFDTGSPYSYIYERELESLQELGIKTEEVLQNNARYVKQLDFVSGDNHFKISMIKILENYGHGFTINDTIARIGIGTIGSDFITDRITSIDFKKQNIELFKTRPQWMSRIKTFKPFDFTGRRVMLPVQLDQKDYEFLYDSGCSAFGLITIKSRFENYTNENSKEIKYDAKSWNNQLPIRSKLTDKVFTVGHTDLKLKRVSYMDMYTFLQPIMTPFTRIGGWLGNQPFNESTLILDTKAEEFVVLN